MSGQRRLPIATLLLIAANLAAAFGLLWQSVLPEEFGFHPERPSFGSAITSLFLHQNLMHLLGNMVFLAAVGAAVEIATGTFRFVVVYFASGLAGVGLYAAMFVPVSGPEPSTLIGASGAVAGCVGYYSAKYITVRVPVWPGVTASVAFLTSLWALLQIAGALIPLGGVVPTTAYSAHLGGLAMGLIASLLFRAPDLGDRRLGHVLLDRMSDRSAAASLATAMRHLEAHPNDVKALRDLADAAGAMGDRALEKETVLRLFEASGDADQVALVSRLADIGGLAAFTSLQRTMMAERWRKSGPEAAETLLRSVTEAPGDPQCPDALLGLARLKWDADRDEATRLLAELQRRYPMHSATELARRRGWLS